MRTIIIPKDIWYYATQKFVKNEINNIFFELDCHNIRINTVYISKDTYTRYINDVWLNGYFLDSKVYDIDTINFGEIKLIPLFSIMETINITHEEKFSYKKFVSIIKGHI